jgi:hypothetical protein
MTEVAQIYGPLFPNVTVYVFVLAKNGLGYILGDMFTNSSGHPAGEPLWFSGE